jgi:hypothetical protein
LPACPNKVVPSRDLDQLRHPVAAGHQRLDPFDERHAWPRAACHPRPYGAKARLHLADQPAASVRNPERAGHAPDVVIHVGHAVRPQRHDLHRPPRPRAGCRLDVAQAHRAHLAVVLGDDHIRRQGLQRLAVDAIDRQPVAHDLAHAGVDLGARALDLEFRRRQRRQGRDIGREIALMAAPHQPLARAQRAHDLGGAGDQADDALLLSADMLAPSAVVPFSLGETLRDPNHRIRSRRG